MPPEVMFDRAFDSARQDRKDLVQFLAGVSEAQARWCPPNEEWSILQGLEHVMLTEAFFRRNILRTLEKAESSGIWDNTPADTHAKMSAEALRRREQGFVAAPDPLEPRGEGDFHTMQTALIADRETSRDALLPYRTQDLSRLIFPHPRYGDRHLYDVIEYSGKHFENRTSIKRQTVRLHPRLQGRNNAGFPIDQGAVAIERYNRKIVQAHRRLPLAHPVAAAMAPYSAATSKR